jgi:DNA-binding response OmpR family regulator
MMPEKPGIEVCREIRKTLSTPIIILTAKGEEIDRVLGLELGADDYIVKPFSPREVLARIKAVLRRINEPQENVPVLRFEGLEINIDNYQVRVKGELVPFTPKEVEILHLLAAHAGQVMDREQILSLVWGYDYFGDTRTVDTHIKRIRQKIAFDGAPWSLVTVYGVGYKFEVAS